MKIIIKTASILLAAILLLSSCANNGIEMPNTDPPPISTEEITAEPITTEAQTDEPETVPPITTPPETTPPETAPPETEFPPDVEESVISKAVEGVKSKNVFVYSVTNGTLLGYRSNEENICPASVTKLLTALYALSVAPPDHVITVNKNDISLIKKGSAVAGVKAGYKMTVEQLITAMLLPSGNDAAYALAGGIARFLTDDDEFCGKAAIELFMSQLNDYASEIGCTSTCFTVPDGYAGNEHYTSTHDLIIIGTLALQCEYVVSHTSSFSETVKLQSGQSMTLKNTNPFLNPDGPYYSKYVTGLKTGSLSGNYCIYLSAEIEGEELLIGVFGSSTKSGRYDDANKVLKAIAEYKKSGDAA